ncbi:hypothetical protein [Xanthomonas phage Olaya]|nr:hypothetical protein [Xanthomonas phage Olaya]QTZ82462.1 hypothetical protein [Xanthomonas phage Bolivar]QTZ82493.1 hypothetical protein [Xanthomonas phage Usaquen]QTZ82576.1 hypothetical protein [Xanthomonas phage Alcala]QTZ82629.1 hypothetical protein [Xanthomonas phage Fontebon]QTZ82669.1 hypothetical protein [Xanthomonas phage Soumapaz]CAA2366798.1 hypothetical protein [Xylella phage Usme]
MKVLGVANRRVNYRDEEVFIVEITLDEIAKVANKSAYRDGKELAKLLQPGMDYPIAEGYNFRQEIVSACTAMTEAHKKFAVATTTMTGFVQTLPLADATEEGNQQ